MKLILKLIWIIILKVWIYYYKCQCSDLTDYCQKQLNESSKWFEISLSSVILKKINNISDASLKSNQTIEIDLN